MEFGNIFVTLFFAGSALTFILEHFLEYRDFSYRKKHAFDVPEKLKPSFDREKLEKIKSYEDDRYFLWLASVSAGFAADMALVLSGFYHRLFDFFFLRGTGIFWSTVLFLVLSGVPSSLVSFPFKLVREFRIEKKYGFSKMTLRLMFLDMFKSFALSLVISIPLVFVAFALITRMEMWWFLLSCVMVGFSLLVSFIYPIFIAPIFNKFTSLEDGELKDRLENLLKKTGFRSSGIFVMDASKRSGHSNAYFTGFGKSKRIVLFDTLIQQMDSSEIEAVLAHELGHFKKKHIIKRMCFSIPLMFASTFVLSILVKNPVLYSGFGFANEMLSSGVAPGMQLVGMFLVSLSLGGFGILTSPVSNFFSRKDEFEADAFSRELCGSGDSLSSALIKLNKENLSEITPPKIYSVFYYSHPTLPERIAAIEDK